MAFDKKILFSDTIEDMLIAESNIMAVARKPYTGDMVNGGSVKIKSYDDAVIVGSFVEGTPLNRQTMGGSMKTLLIDNADYFNIEVGDITKVQTGSDLNVYAKQAVTKLKNEVENKLWTLRTSATQVDSSAITLTKDNIVEVMESGIVGLEDANVTGNKVVIVNNHIASLLRQSKQVTATNYGESEYGIKSVLTYGDNLMVLVSNLAQPTNGTENEMLFCSVDFLNYAGSIKEVESYRPEDSFADAIKGLNVYGVAVFNSAKGINITTTK